MGATPRGNCAHPSSHPPNRAGLPAGCKQWLLRSRPGEAVGSGHATVPSHHTSVNHAFIAGCRERRAPASSQKAPASSWAALAMPSQAAPPQLAPHLPIAPPTPRPQMGECASQGAWGQHAPAMPPPASAFLRGDPVLPASGLDLQPKASDGDAGVAFGTLQGPGTPQGLQSPSPSSTRLFRPIAVQISRQDAGKSFLLRRSVRMGALLPAELRQPVAQLPGLHTCPAPSRGCAGLLGGALALAQPKSPRFSPLRRKLSPWQGLFLRERGWRVIPSGWKNPARLRGVPVARPFLLLQRRRLLRVRVLVLVFFFFSGHQFS